jgi:hypothetical protein
MIDISFGFKQVRFPDENVGRVDIGRKLYGRNHDLVDRYGIYVSQALTGPFLVHNLST